MLEKISMLPIAAYLAFTGFVRSFRKDDRGLSGVVVAILLILVAVLAVLIIWTSLGDWLRDLWDRITNKAAEVR